MNFNWLKSQEVLNSENAITAENRLMALKKAGKVVKKSLEESLRTTSSRSSVKNDDLDSKKRRASEHLHGENLASACFVLSEVKSPVPNTAISPLQTILEHYANLEKTIAHMLAVNETEIENLMSSDTPLIKLLSEEIPQFCSNKKELEHLAKKYVAASNLLEKENKKLDKMELQKKEQIAAAEQHSTASFVNSGSMPDSVSDEIVDSLPDSLSIVAQREKTERLCHEKENLEKDLGIEEGKVTSTLLTLTSRENRYATTILDLMRLKKDFFENAYKTMEAELPNIERILLETGLRPVFGEHLADHLRSTGRIIALPIHLSVRNLLLYGMEEEGLFRISPKQIKLDKYKAVLDSQSGTLTGIDPDDSHLQAGLLKCYLRELPEPLLVTADEESPESVYSRWIQVSVDKNEKISSYRRVLNGLTKQALDNFQFIAKFLHILSGRSEITKMTSKNLAIILGPNLLARDKELDQSRLDNVISIVVTLIERYSDVFPEDINLNQFDSDIEDLIKNCTLSDNSTLKTPNGYSQSTSPGHKRRQSFRTFRKNIMAKLSPPISTNSSSSSSYSPNLTHKTIIIEKDHDSV